jgi:hypothetical protein
MSCDAFTVCLKEETFDMDMITREFLLQSIDEDYEFNCTMTTASYWPDSCTPVKTTFDLVRRVKASRSPQQQQQQQQHHHIHHNLTANFNTINGGHNYTNCIPPVVVVDLYGGWRAGCFCALYTLQDAVQLESSCNVYELAKLYHLKRPGIWAAKSNLLFLYEAVHFLFEELLVNHHRSGKAVAPPASPNYYNLIDTRQQSSFMTKQNSAGVNSNNNNSSILLLPSSATLPLNSSYAAGKMNTRPSNNAVFTASHQRNLSMTNNNPVVVNGNGFVAPVPNNASIGARLHNFKNSQQQQHRSLSSDMRLLDPACVIPLASFTTTTTPNSNSKPARQHRPHLSRFQTVNNSIRKNISDLPRLLRRNMLSQQLQSQESGGKKDTANISTITNSNDLNSTQRLAQQQQQHQSTTTTGRSLSAYYHNSKAMKLVASMKVKSASFRRNLFTQSVSETKTSLSSSSNNSSPHQSTEVRGGIMDVNKSAVGASPSSKQQKPNIMIEMSTTSTTSSTTSSASSSSKAVDEDADGEMMMMHAAYPSPNSTTKILPDKLASS